MKTVMTFLGAVLAISSANAATTETYQSAVDLAVKCHAAITETKGYYQAVKEDATNGDSLNEMGFTMAATSAYSASQTRHISTPHADLEIKVSTASNMVNLQTTIRERTATGTGIVLGHDYKDYGMSMNYVIGTPIHLMAMPYNLQILNVGDEAFQNHVFGWGPKPAEQAILLANHVDVVGAMVTCDFTTSKK